MMTRRWVVASLMAVALMGCRGAPTPTSTPIVTAPTPPPGPRFTGGGVIASGQVVPAEEADMSFAVSGRVEALAVEVGDTVQRGDVLVTMETDLLAARVRKAEAALAVARANLAVLVARPRPEQVAVAKAQLENAEGELSQAAARRDRPDVGATEAEVAAAQSDVAAAMAERLVAEEFHDKTMKCVNVELPGEGEQAICPLLGPMEEKARYRWYATEEEVDVAQAQLDALLAGGDAEVRAARAAVSAAAARRDVAKAQLDTVQAEARAEEIAAAEARITQAGAALRAARAALGQATLRAPFAGGVTAIEVRPVEAVTPGQAVLTLADLRSLRVETTDLSERDVDRVSVGQQAAVYVEALDTQIRGEVVAIASQADTIGGDVVYPVTVELDERPPGLRWGMSVEVEITVE